MEGFVFHWGVFTTPSDCLSRGVDGVTPADDKQARYCVQGHPTPSIVPQCLTPPVRGFLSQQLPVLFEPLLRDLEIRTHRFDLLPESAGVVVFPQVHQLVQDDVFPDMRRCLNQSPVQGDGSTTGTRSPARPLVADRNTAD